MFKNSISTALPESLFLLASGYENDTEGDILSMGY
jgi:hypothetical protein